MTVLRVMTWNVQNLFEPATPDGPNTQDAYNRKLDALASVINTVRPHVLALQEVGPEPALIALQQRLTWTLPHRALGTPDRRGIRVAYLSKRVLRNIEHIQTFPEGLLPIQTGDDPDGPEGPPTMNRIARGGLKVTVRAGGRDVHIVNCHLKSKLLTFPGGRFSPTNEFQRSRFAAYALYRRTSEAATLRAYVTELLTSDDPVVFLGDLNDEERAATTQIMQGPPGSELGTRGFDRPDAGDTQRLWNLASLIAPERRSSRRYRGRDELIDHIFASQQLITDGLEVNTYSVNDLALPSINDTPTTEIAQGTDHAAVTAFFQL